MVKNAVNFSKTILRIVFLAAFFGSFALPLHAAEKNGLIINAHEHIQSSELAPNFLEAMKAGGVGKVLLVGSPDATFRLELTGFSGADKNNDEILKIAGTFPGQIIPFVAIDGADPKKLEKLRQYLKKGAQGLKLYSGNKRFYSLPLDDSSLDEFYRFCEKEKVPVLWHVNTGYYLSEFERALTQHPALKVICPHFCLSTIAAGRFEYLMDAYPELRTDASFGPMEYVKAGMMRFSADPEKFRKLVEKYQDRIFFATDMAVSKEPHQTVEWMTRVTRGYRDLLETEKYSFFALPGISLKGLHLDPPVLRKIYQTNFEKFMEENKKDS